jgi:hypothetical protein
MGKSRWPLRQSKRLINVFVAGMFVFMGIQASVTTGTVLKPHRLERTQTPDQSWLPTAQGSQNCHGDGSRHVFCPQLANHEFVYGFLPGAALVTDYTQAQIGFEGRQSPAQASRPTETASPRGPPQTAS